MDRPMQKISFNNVFLKTQSGNSAIGSFLQLFYVKRVDK